MDLETENRIAAILLKEAAELRRKAEEEGVRAYLQKPNVRFRPNSRFLTATVLGVQQANKAVEVDEMWRLRNKELELNERLKGKTREASSCSQSDKTNRNLTSSSSKRYTEVHENAPGSSLSSKQTSEERWYPREEDEGLRDEGLRDEEVEEFLHSRVRRGRGSVGSRMDEAGPYLSPSLDAMAKHSIKADTREHCAVLGPKRPPSLRFPSDSSSEDDSYEHVSKKLKKNRSDSSNRKRKSKEKKSKDKKKKKEEKKKKRHK